MRFTSFVAAGVFAIAAHAQSDSVTSGPASTEATPTQTGSTSATTDPVTASMVACLGGCDESDVNCRADCITVPSPNEGAVIETNDCVAACPQGNGTEADINNYDSCVRGCISEHFYTTPGAPSPTGSGSESDSEASASEIVSTVTEGSSTFETTITSAPTQRPSGTGEQGSQSTSSSGGGADALFSPIGSTGLIGLVAALFAL
jgi:hypothetical protein